MYKSLILPLAKEDVITSYSIHYTKLYETIKNYSANETRRIDMVVGVGYDDDLGVAVRTCMDVISADARVLPDPAPQVAVSELGDSYNFV